MTRAVFHPGEAVPAGTPFCEWVNVTGAELQLHLPNLGTIRLCRDDRLQVPCDDLAKVPALEGWLEGLELRGTLMRL